MKVTWKDGKPVRYQMKKIGGGEYPLAPELFKDIENGKVLGNKVNAVYLHLHYPVGRILYNSGLEEAIEDYYENMEEED